MLKELQQEIEKNGSEVGRKYNNLAEKPGEAIASAITTITTTTSIITYIHPVGSQNSINKN